MLTKLLLTTAAVALTSALDNGLGQTPGMGWNSDYCTKCVKPAAAAAAGENGFQYDSFVRHIADTLVSSGLAAKGYTYVNMDASWDTLRRDNATGDLVPDPALWPRGIESVIGYVHERGLGFGLYGDKGDLDCAKHPGQLGHEEQDARFLARLGVDWWKEDSCDSGGTHAEQLAAYVRSLLATY